MYHVGEKEIDLMKTTIVLAALAIGISATAMAADFKGYVEDTACSTMPAMKADVECAKKCVKEGSPAVLVMADGKIYKIANQDKIKEHAGETVTVSGSLKDDTITVASVKKEATK